MLHSKYHGRGIPWIIAQYFKIIKSYFQFTSFGVRIDPDYHIRIEDKAEVRTMI